jgi:glycosyltransferase involved in cell wall biosynthesis
MPRVSVLLPVRDARPTLGECLRSLSAQTLEEHEVVAVDDGSVDGSGEVLLAHARADPRLRVVRTEARGLVPALNTALAHARAPLLARMDGDDVAHAERLARQAERLEAEPGLQILGCRVRLLAPPRAHNQGMRAYVRWQNALLDHDAITRDLFVESPLAHPSVMMRRTALLALRGYRAFDGPEDYDLWLRAHAAGFRFAKLDQTLLSWRDGSTRLSRTDPRYATERFRQLKLEALLRGPLCPARPVVIWGAGRVGKGWSRALRSRGQVVSAFVEVDPRKIGWRIHGAPVVAVAGAGNFPGHLHLAAVGQPGARARIREEAHKRGLEEGRDLLALA